MNSNTKMLSVLSILPVMFVSLLPLTVHADEQCPCFDATMIDVACSGQSLSSKLYPRDCAPGNDMSATSCQQVSVSCDPANPPIYNATFEVSVREGRYECGVFSEGGSPEGWSSPGSVPPDGLTIGQANACLALVD